MASSGIAKSFVYSSPSDDRNGGVAWWPSRRILRGAMLLRADPLFGQLAGQKIIGPPMLLPPLLGAIEDVGPLYPRKWDMAREYSKLAGFWQSVKTGEERLRCGELELCAGALVGALSEVIDSDLLARLVPHSDVLPELRRLRESLSRFDPNGSESASQLLTALKRIEVVMAPYRFGA